MGAPGQDESGTHRARALDVIRSIVFQRLAGRKARVFLIGSCARGDWHQASDIDIALAPLEPLEPRIILSIRQALDDSDVPYFVDVIDISTVDEAFAETVYREGVEWTGPSTA